MGAPTPNSTFQKQRHSHVVKQQPQALPRFPPGSAPAAGQLSSLAAAAAGPPAAVLTAPHQHLVPPPAAALRQADHRRFHRRRHRMQIPAVTHAKLQAVAAASPAVLQPAVGSFRHVHICHATLPHKLMRYACNFVLQVCSPAAG